MALVSGHPAVVQLYGAGTAQDGRSFLVMEYCPVANIMDQVRQKPMSTDRALSMIIRMCGGAEMLHRVGFVHRDIKPSNIMVNAYGSPVLTDFGCGGAMWGQIRAAAAMVFGHVGTARADRGYGAYPSDAGRVGAGRDAVDAADGSPALRGARRR